jgi:hypothetical protein
VREIFLQTLIDMTGSEGLRIEAGCLQYITDLVSHVSAEHASELRDRETYDRVYAGFQEFVSRMIADARSKGYSSLHEDTFFAARSKCGLVFWCE